MAKNLAALREHAKQSRDKLAQYYNGERDLNVQNDEFMHVYITLQRLVASVDQYLAEMDCKKTKITAIYSATDVVPE